jgi:hypothetical protein
MRILRYFIITAVMAVMICSCTDTNKAQGLVNSFMKENMEDNVELTNVTFSKLDSTTRVSDSTLKAMQTEANRIPLYKKNLTFNKKTSSPLLFISVKYRTANDSTLRQQTFYIDKDITDIVAVKNY